MIDILKEIDRNLFFALNGHHSPLWDNIMHNITQKYFWVPFYVLLAAFLVYVYRKNSILILAVIGLIITFADRISSGFFKPVFERYRPCHDPIISEKVILVGKCGGNFGFISSHAANSFALAIFLYLILGKSQWHLKVVLILWALALSYSRVYLGVHYPGDIICGALLGGLLGYGFSIIYRKLAEKLPFFEAHPH